MSNFFHFLYFYSDFYHIFIFFFFSSRRRHTRSYGDWSSDVCSSDLEARPTRKRRSMPRTEKVEKVAELKARIEGSQAMFLTDFRGLTVGDATDLRRSLRESGTKLAVVKNT